MAAVAERRIAAVIGAAVADAAAQPLHWNYNKEKLDALVAGKEEVEFWEPSQNPFYRIATGKHSCYGDQADAILRSLVHCKGVDLSNLKKEHYMKFGPESEYENKSKDGAEIAMPISSPWRHGSIKDFLKKYEAGSEETGSETDTSQDCVAKIAPVVAKYAGHPDLLEKVEDVIRVTQQSDVPVSSGLAAARILEHFILHGRDPDAFNKVIKELSNPKRKNPQDLDKAVAGLPGSFQSACHGVLTGKDYVRGVRETIRAGGCNCSRAAFIGACLAAQGGLDSIPESWRRRTLGYDELVSLTEQLTTSA